MSVLWTQHPAEADLALFAGGELGPIARWRIERHVESCQQCKESVADFFHLQEDLAELAQTPALDWDVFGAQIQAAVATARVADDQSQTRANSWPWLRVGALAAAAASAVVVFNIGWQPEPDAPAESVAPVLQAEADAVAPLASTSAPAPANEALAFRAKTAPEPARDEAPQRRQVALLEKESAPTERKNEFVRTGAAELREELSRPSVAAPMPADIAQAAAPPARLSARSFDDERTVAPAERSRLRTGMRPEPIPAVLSDGASQLPTGFSPLPADAGPASLDVAASGWVSVRSVESGTVTIVDVYR